ncbi:MAG: uracil-DNA glycosylase family protein [Candidatus Hadarchaeum sp.]|uniref:uracil-DNA glycosylase family protein n=1 Tax=Candidatus Hadarchaeum sp. TaxID=2883567 RepID=UPI003D09CF4E
MGIATEDLERRIKTCTLCRLHRLRKNAVPGEGPHDARVMLLGEAPGRNEDLRGVPFCGAAGKFLDELLGIAGLRREEVYITNTVKCRPPQNRAPLDDEIKICTGKYLKKQVKLIKPELIVALGRIAAKALLGKEIPITAYHGKMVKARFAGLTLSIFLTYHPAAALYGAKTRLKLKEDFAKLAEVLKTI